MRPGPSSAIVGRCVASLALGAIVAWRMHEGKTSFFSVPIVLAVIVVQFAFALLPLLTEMLRVEGAPWWVWALLLTMACGGMGLSIWGLAM
ncbi:MAG: hypothetical protein ACAI43_12015 [Phycisphaerae bacterium]|nr:hypothetical protein [Tepidisphaeraceae bacterium]